MKTRRDVFQAIADPTRREILLILVQGPQNLNAIADRFDMSRQAISLHIKVLTECEVVNIESKGRERICKLKPEKLNEVEEFLGPFKQYWEDSFDALEALLQRRKPKKDE